MEASQDFLADCITRDTKGTKSMQFAKEQMRTNLPSGILDKIIVDGIQKSLCIRSKSPAITWSLEQSKMLLWLSVRVPGI